MCEKGDILSLTQGFLQNLNLKSDHNNMTRNDEKPSPQDLEPDSLYDPDFESDDTSTEDQDTVNASDNNSDQHEFEEESINRMAMTRSSHIANSVNHVENDQSSYNQMSKSLVVRSDSRLSQNSISFFIDLSDNSTPTGTRKSIKKKPDHQEVKCYKGIFSKIQEYLRFVSDDCNSREEVKQKLQLAKRLKKFMTEEEKRLKNGQDPSTVAKLDSTMSAFESQSVQQGEADQRPVLRRERTFDLAPAGNLNEMQVVDIAVEDGRNRPDSSQTCLSNEQQARLEVFQERVELPFRRLNREINRLYALDRELSLKASFCGPERIHCWEDEVVAGCKSSTLPVSPKPSPVKPQLRPVPRPRTIIPALQPKRPSRRCDSLSSMSQSFHEDLLQKPLAGHAMITLADVSRQKHSESFKITEKSSHISSSCAWFIPNSKDDDHETGDDTVLPNEDNDTKPSLIQTFEEKKRSKSKAEAYFIECTAEKSPVPRNNMKTLNKLKTHDSNKIQISGKNTNNVQEALKTKRPECIQNSNHRRTDLLAKKMVARNRNSILENIPTHYDEIRKLNRRTKEREKEALVSEQPKSLQYQDQVGLNNNKKDGRKQRPRTLSDPVQQSPKPGGKIPLRKLPVPQQPTRSPVIKDHPDINKNQGKKEPPALKIKERVHVEPKAKSNKSPYSQNMSKLSQRHKGLPGLPRVALLNSNHTRTTKINSIPGRNQSRKNDG